MPRDKDRIPHAGETVYLKNDPRSVAMYLERVFVKDKVQYARCSWKEYDMVDDELMATEKEKEFLFSDLTVYPPGTE